MLVGDHHSRSSQWANREVDIRTGFGLCVLCLCTRCAEHVHVLWVGVSLDYINYNYLRFVAGATDRSISTQIRTDTHTNDTTCEQSFSGDVHTLNCWCGSAQYTRPTTSWDYFETKYARVCDSRAVSCENRTCLTRAKHCWCVWLMVGASQGLCAVCGARARFACVFTGGHTTIESRNRAATAPLIYTLGCRAAPRTSEFPVCVRSRIALDMYVFICISVCVSSLSLCAVHACMCVGLVNTLSPVCLR